MCNWTTRADVWQATCGVLPACCLLLTTALVLDRADSRAACWRIALLRADPKLSTRSVGPSGECRAEGVIVRRPAALAPRGEPERGTSRGHCCARGGAGLGRREEGVCARSLGVILYALCYSRLPFGADLSYEQLRKRIVDPAPPELPGAPRRCRRPHSTLSAAPYRELPPAARAPHRCDSHGLA